MSAAPRVSLSPAKAARSEISLQNDVESPQYQPLCMLPCQHSKLRRWRFETFIQEEGYEEEEYALLKELQEDFRAGRLSRRDYEERYEPAPLTRTLPRRASTRVEEWPINLNRAASTRVEEASRAQVLALPRKLAAGIRGEAQPS